MMEDHKEQLMPMKILPRKKRRGRVVADDGFEIPDV